MNNERPVLKTKTIMNQFKRNGDLTLATMADNYGMPEEEFLVAIKKVVGKENFSDLEKLNYKRLKAGKGKPVVTSKGDDDEVKAMVRKDLLEQKENNAQTEETETNKVETLQKKLQITNTLISTIEGELQALNGLQMATKAQIVELQQELSKLKAEETEQAVSLQEKEAQLENAKAEKEQLQNELDKLTIVVLIAPRYKGGSRSKEMKMVSTKGRDGIEEQRVPKEEWISKPTWEAFVNSQHRERELFEEDFEFVQLVLKYQLEGKKFELKANETLRRMIAFEGGEV